ncbi:bifunctional 4-hydroxy-2-oxoglutarate aldolase/2-dehydro-3-deoxy-phosphogluconate aldolase [Paenibacillus sp. MMS18-CY102]|uniref:bifunctional 4-hydroxy-2-oxoglutarate aldolase/2-dehydro-3-deoxy-phosphogluconate aldolase n=1 Tax=Paenibacillus sp. MMS18-CY102 TaxID=2682849 RepID=UPI0013656333|nr:bifunctional 4-hydroxy-2-oxoglutarate aldolase/2-dehydro-3-deoxy-phosphogluconate aldolase [Paenibacillus sp. MMS18-CY102]MWC30324.1 bifunctional 4-hydroxy-2-oxoglutarate aldolase/2-dehydro-3-deoxy-phosphogluconate aldolase [Paenibacillus sp. MMS18-CY102]
MGSLLEMLQQHKIVAILRGIELQHADATAKAIIDGGVRLLEVTMNTDGATSIINSWRSSFGDGEARIGAGTVLDIDMAKEAVAAGAQFIISPNLDEDVIRYGIEHGVPVWPGCMTPTEIVRAWKAGAEAVKVFPMGTLGWKYLAEIRAPLDRIPMLATGGVDLDNIGDYFRAGACAVGMGGKLVNLDWVRAGEYERVTERVRQFVDVAAKL